jgi:hypothetical protein
MEHSPSRQTPPVLRTNDQGFWDGVASARELELQGLQPAGVHTPAPRAGRNGPVGMEHGSNRQMPLVLQAYYRGFWAGLVAARELGLQPVHAQRAATLTVQSATIDETPAAGEIDRRPALDLIDPRMLTPCSECCPYRGGHARAGDGCCVDCLLFLSY